MYLEVFWRLGEKVQMWLKELKIAVIQKDMQKLDSLLQDIPTIKDTKEIEEVLYLLKQATHDFEQLRDETRLSMEQVKKTLIFWTPHTPKQVQNLI